MTRDKAKAVVESMFPSFWYRGLKQDGDGYWTCQVSEEGGAVGFLSFPDWYPEGYTLEWNTGLDEF